MTTISDYIRNYDDYCRNSMSAKDVFVDKDWCVHKKTLSNRIWVWLSNHTWFFDKFSVKKVKRAFDQPLHAMFAQFKKNQELTLDNLPFEVGQLVEDEDMQGTVKALRVFTVLRNRFEKRELNRHAGQLTWTNPQNPFNRVYEYLAERARPAIVATERAPDLQSATPVGQDADTPVPSTPGDAEEPIAQEVNHPNRNRRILNTVGTAVETVGPVAAKVMTFGWGLTKPVLNGVSSVVSCLSSVTTACMKAAHELAIATGTPPNYQPIVLPEQI